MTPPRPTLPEPPPRLSASAWQSLVACPYQYFARHGLGLRERDEVPEEMEKRDYGERVHAILRAFHQDHPRLAGREREGLVRALEELSQAHFAPAREAHWLARAWLFRWLRQVPAYVDWALDREARGYIWRGAEVDFRVPFPSPEAGGPELVGRLDRLDQGPHGPAVLDYKAQNRTALNRKVKNPGEDVQLPFYGLLAAAGAPDSPRSEAAFVALDDERLGDVPWPGDLAEAAAREAERIAAVWAGLKAGEVLPAQGAEASCQRCEMRGLCRRDHWRADPAG